MHLQDVRQKELPREIGDCDRRADLRTDLPLVEMPTKKMEIILFVAIKNRKNYTENNK